MKIKIQSFQDLSTDELYAILSLRSEIFVVEQDCVYQDIDFKDQKAWHISGYLNEELVAYTRVFKPGDYFNQASIGRVLVRENKRSLKLGHLILEESINCIEKEFNTDSIQISAQSYLKSYYEKHGFKATGKEYLEDGIPHMEMIRKNSNV